MSSCPLVAHGWCRLRRPAACQAGLQLGLALHCGCLQHRSFRIFSHRPIRWKTCLTFLETLGYRDLEHGAVHRGLHHLALCHMVCTVTEERQAISLGGLYYWLLMLRILPCNAKYSCMGPTNNSHNHTMRATSNRNCRNT
jgi:hypothetical protein